LRTGPIQELDHPSEHRFARQLQARIEAMDQRGASLRAFVKTNMAIRHSAAPVTQRVVTSDLIDRSAPSE
jgi:hypothetical protein